MLFFLQVQMKQDAGNQVASGGQHQGGGEIPVNGHDHCHDRTEYGGKGICTLGPADQVFVRLTQNFQSGGEK